MERFPHPKRQLHTYQQSLSLHPGPWKPLIYSVSTDLPAPNISFRSIQRVAFGVWPFTWQDVFRVHPHWGTYLPVLHSFHGQSSTVWTEHSLFMPSSGEGFFFLIVSTFWLSWVMLLSTFRRHVFIFLECTARSGTAGSWGNPVHPFEELRNSFPEWLHCFILLAANIRGY